MNLHSLSQWSYLFAWKQILLPSFNCILKEKVKIMFVLNLLISWQTSRSSTLKRNIFLNTVRAIVALSREGFFSYHTCCDTGSWFLWSHHKDPLIYLLSFYNMQGEQSTYSNLSPQGIPCTMTPLLDMYDCPLWELWVSDIFILVLSLVLSTHCLMNHLYWTYLTWVDEPKSFSGPGQGQTVGRNSRSRS